MDKISISAANTTSVFDNSTADFKLFDNTSTTDVSYVNLYSTPELINRVVYSDRIELIFKKYYMVSVGSRMPDPIIYAEVYSRTDGSMFIKEGTYIPPQPESYHF